MTREDYPAFVKALVRTAETFREPLSPDRMDAFFEALSDLPLAHVIAALRTLEQRAEWFPRGPAVVRSAAAGTVDEAAERAWQRFRWALQHVTIYDAIDFQDPALTATVVSMFGGWVQTAEIQSARMGLIRQDFLKTYATCVRAGLQSHDPLPGELEQAPVRVVPMAAMPTALVQVPPPPPPASRNTLVSLNGDPVSISDALEPWQKKSSPTI